MPDLEDTEFGKRHFHKLQSYLPDMVEASIDNYWEYFERNLFNWEGGGAPTASCYTDLGLKTCSRLGVQPRPAGEQGVGQAGGQSL